jgi:glutaredoxin 3
MYVIAVFSKSYCPYCKATKATLDDLGAQYFSIELDQVGRWQFLTFNPDRAALKEISGQSSVPNIYIKKEHIGGNSDLQAKKGDLPELLKDAGAL